MKTKEELKQIKNEDSELNKKFAELTEEEIKQVNGGNSELDSCKLPNREPSPSIPQIDENAVSTPVTGYWQGGTMANHHYCKL